MPCTSSSQPRFTAWLCLGISKPSTRSSHLRLPYSSGRMAPGKHRQGLTLACTTRKPQALNTQWTATDHSGAPPPCPCTANPQRRVVVSGHRQSLLLTGLDKSLPLICQQPPRLNYKRRVHSAPTEGTPQAPSLGDGEAVPLGPTGHLPH